jgi:hypothetical protein
MSGILLPGQGKDPKTEGKIELPKGFSSARRERQSESAETAAPAVSQEQEAPGQPPVAEQRAAGKQGLDLLFPPRGAQVRCPSCGTPYVVPVFSIIDLGANPELRAPLLGGQINVAQCPSCGAGGVLGAPLMVHDPGHQFLGVYAPMESRQGDLQRQKAIGDLTQVLMRKIPAEARKGYMLQPQQFADWQRFIEKMWEFEGVTAEMLRRQREQTALLQRLMALANDEKALQMAIERDAALIDRDFFSMLDQIIMMGRSQGQGEELQGLMGVRQKLLDSTEAGKQVRQQQERVRGVLAQIQPETSREQLLDIVISTWQEPDGQQIVGTLAVVAGNLFDYQLLLLLAQRIEEATDESQRAKLEELRKFVTQMQEQLAAQQRQSRDDAAQQAQALLQEVLQSTNTEATLRENAELIDEAFLAVLMANIQGAERNNATAAARRLRQIYEQALALIQDSMPPSVQLLNQLLTAPDDATMRQLLKENRALLDKQFLDALKPLENEMRSNGRADLAERLKSLRAQIALMI